MAPTTTSTLRTPAVTVRIDRAWHRLLYPLPNQHRIGDDNIQDRMRDLRRESRRSHRARYALVFKRLKKDQTVAPFKVWRDGKRLVICDGRHYEYSAAKRLNLKISTIDIGAVKRDAAEGEVLVSTLLNSGRALHSDYYRVLLALRCPEALEYCRAAEVARTRKSVKAKLPKQAAMNTRAWVASLAGVSDGQVAKVKRLLKYGPTYLEGRWADIHASLEIGDMGINAAYTKLREAEERSKSVFEMAQKRGEKPEDVRHFSGRPATLRALSARSMKRKEAAESFTPTMKRKLSVPAGKTFTSCIVNADFRAGMKAMLDNTGPLHPDLIFGSPPYPVDLEYPDGRNYASTPQQWITDFIEPVARLGATHAREGTRLALQFSDVFVQDEDGRRGSLHYPLLADVVNCVRGLGLGWMYRETKKWTKFTTMSRPPAGSYASPLDPKNYLNHEHIVVFSFQSTRLTAPEGIVSDMTNDEYRQWATSDWYIAPISRMVKGHPAPFPESLAERVVKLYSWPTSLVIDPWVGTGTTAAVCARHGRRWLGFDIDPRSAAQAYERTIEEADKFATRSRKAGSK